MSYNVIFTDIDGVLNSEADSPEGDISLGLLHNFKRLVDEAQAKVVISSGWRLNMRLLQEIFDIFRDQNIPLIGVTPTNVMKDDLQGSEFENIKPLHPYSYTTDYYEGKIEYIQDRGAEIAFWIKQHKKDISNFVILDDEIKDIINYFPHNTIQTSYEVGLAQDDIYKSLKILNIVNGDNNV